MHARTHARTHAHARTHMHRYIEAARSRDQGSLEGTHTADETALLVEIFKHVNEPDGLYAVNKDDSLLSRTVTYSHEKDWLKVAHAAHAHINTCIYAQPRACVHARMHVCRDTCTHEHFD